MKIKNKIIRFASWLVLATFVLVSNGNLPAGEQPAGGQNSLRVGVAPDMPPMIFKEGNNLAGIEADLAKVLGRELGRTIQFVELPWPDLLDSLEAGKVDIIMSSMSITRARLARVAFSDPYLRVGQKALVRAQEKYQYPFPGSSLVEKKVGVRKATTGDLLIQQEFPRAKLKYFDSGDEAAKALLKKKIDLYVSDSSMIWYLAGKYEAQGLVAAPAVYSDEMLAWAMKRSDTELVGSVNKALKSITASGELKEVVKRWVPSFE